MSGLTEFQAEVTRLFFSQPSSEGFLLAGGGAVLASGLTTRPTEDLDFFGDRDHVDIAAARDQLEAAVAERGWQSRRVQDGATFVRLHVSDDDEVIVDLAIDAPAGRPPVVPVVGPTFHPEELAGRKLIALFDRAEARDFADVYTLAHRFGREILLQPAEVDLGFDHGVPATMLRSLDRFSDDELPAETNDLEAVRAYFRDWAHELSRSGGSKST